MIYDDPSTSGHVDLHMTQGDGTDFPDMRFFLVSENGLIAGDRVGIHLYHIPELGDVDDGSFLAPVWSWFGDASGYHGTTYRTVSPYPALWLQGEQITHTLEFDVDESGCFPIVANHHITLGQPAYYVERYLKLRGQKVMSTEVRQGGEVVFRTGVLGKPDLARELRASLPGRRLRGRRWLEQNGVKYTGLDEVTGRILVVIGTVPDQGADNIPYARRLCLVDLPI